MDQFARSTMRAAKNYTKGYSDVQIKVREATSNDPWGPSGTQMSELADLTNRPQEFLDIMDILDKRLNDSGKNWRHVFKALTVLDYILHCGSEQVIAYAKQNLYIIKTLKEFQYIDDEGKDQGMNVREKSKQIAALLADDERLKEERKSRSALRQKMGNTGFTGGSGYGRESSYGRESGAGYGRNETYSSRQRNPSYQPSSEYEEERQIEKALEESRRMEDERRAREREREESELKKALEISQRQTQAPSQQVQLFGQQQQQFGQQKAQPTQSIDLWGDSTVDQKKNDLDFFGSMSQPQPVQQSQPDPFGFSPQKVPNNASFSGNTSQDFFGAQAVQTYQQPGFASGGDQFFNGQRSNQMIAQNPVQQAPSQTDFFGSAFDGGAGQKNLVPRYVQDQQSQNPNAALAHIARNAVQIDPFASMAKSSGSLNQSGNAGSQNNNQLDFNLFGNAPVNPPQNQFQTNTPAQRQPAFGNAGQSQPIFGNAPLNSQPAFGNQLTHQPLTSQSSFSGPNYNVGTAGIANQPYNGFSFQNQQQAQQQNSAKTSQSDPFAGLVSLPNKSKQAAGPQTSTLSGMSNLNQNANYIATSSLQQSSSVRIQQQSSVPNLYGQQPQMQNNGINNNFGQNPQQFQGQQQFQQGPGFQNSQNQMFSQQQQQQQQPQQQQYGSAAGMSNPNNFFF